MNENDNTQGLKPDTTPDDLTSSEVTSDKVTSDNKVPASLTERLTDLQPTPANEPQIKKDAEYPPIKPVAVKQTVKQKVIIKKYGLAHAIFRPISIAFLMLVGTYISISMAMNFWHGYQRDLDYAKTRHIDKSALEIFQSSTISKDRIELVIRNFNGELEKRAASHSQLSRYIKQSAADLDQARNASDEMINLKLEQLFSKSFEGKEQHIAKYADWFFEWKRPYIILKEAISSTTSRLVKLGEYESLRTAVERDMSDYFMRHYKEQVLKPEQRDAMIVAGIETIAREAHKNYLEVMKHQDSSLKEFISTKTTYLETLPKQQDLTRTTLDWDAQRWKNPTYLMEDRAFDGIAGLGRVAVGGTIGALALGPAVNRGLGSVFTPLARRFATSMGARITLAEGGAVAGTAVEPVGGTIVGAAIGVVLGFAADYVANKLNEKFSREKFINANEEALQSTIDLWQQKMTENMQQQTGNWYDEAKAGLILVREIKPELNKSTRPDASNKENMPLF